MSEQDALDYHSEGKPGKIEVVPTKPLTTQRDLSLAYSPGVAIPSLAIAKEPQDAYKYTSKGNLVAVISNGTAVLGLGDIGAQAAKPVMEGKGYRARHKRPRRIHPRSGTPRTYIRRRESGRHQSTRMLLHRRATQEETQDPHHAR